MTIDWDLLHGASRIWAFELFSIDGSPLTIGKLITGLFLLGLGYWAARRATDAVDRRFLSRVDIDASLRYTLKRVIFYFLLAVVTLFTLRALNVPITVFTVLGGALAIGFGFGSQNVVNNFISGVIMMVERPIRIGDFVEVENLKGTIEVIGIRATQIRTPQNQRLVVPNSFFLEKAVVNWTLIDDVVRSKVTVGVAYSSNLEQVRQTLEKVANEHSQVLKDPPARVVLADFADSAVVFEVFVWISMGADKLPVEVESDLRFAIAAEFSRLGIQMPFPQREIRLISTVGESPKI